MDSNVDMQKLLHVAQLRFFLSCVRVRLAGDDEAECEVRAH